MEPGSETVLASDRAAYPPAEKSYVANLYCTPPGLLSPRTWKLEWEDPGVPQLFDPPRPELALTPAEQRGALQALDGASDQTVAAAPGLSVETVRARWRSIYVRLGHLLTRTRPHPPSAMIATTSTAPVAAIASPLVQGVPPE